LQLHFKVQVIKVITNCSFTVVSHLRWQVAVSSRW